MSNEVLSHRLIRLGRKNSKRKNLRDPSAEPTLSKVDVVRMTNTSTLCVEDCHSGANPPSLRRSDRI